MDIFLFVLAVVALLAIIASHAFWAWSLWKEKMEKMRKFKNSVSIETVCDECGHSMAQAGAYIFRKQYLCGDCLRKRISSLKEKGE